MFSHQWTDTFALSILGYKLCTVKAIDSNIRIISALRIRYIWRVCRWDVLFWNTKYKYDKSDDGVVYIILYNIFFLHFIKDKMVRDCFSRKLIISVHSSINSVLHVTNFYSGFLTTFLKRKKRNIICYIRNALKCFINQNDILQSNSSLRFLA